MRPPSLQGPAKRRGEFHSCCCLPLLPELDCTLLANWEIPSGNGNIAHLRALTANNEYDYIIWKLKISDKAAQIVIL